MRLVRSISLFAVFFGLSVGLLGQAKDQEEFLRSTAEPGQKGGRLVVGQSAEPKTFNPVTVVDQPSRDVIRRMTADLVHINRFTQKTEPALAKSWIVSRDGRQFTLQLRRGVRFSDGVPFDADDVLFSYQVYQDEKVRSPQRDLLLIHDKPMAVEKLGTHTVRFTFSDPYAAGERVFDSIAILPRHLLEKDYKAGQISQTWLLTTAPEKMAGLGPFRLKQVVLGERIVLERNPYYWKVDAKKLRLPYLDELTFLTVPSRDAQVVRFLAGDTHAISSLSAENFEVLSPDQKARHYVLYDLGPGLEYNFLLLNMNDDTEGRLPEVARKQKWFKDVRFRRAVSLAIDRAAIVRLVYHNLATALSTHVSPGNKLWVDSVIPAPERSVSRAGHLLEEAGFSRRADGGLVDAGGSPVEFSILVNASNSQQSQMATLLQDDLKTIGIKVHIVSMEFRSAMSRVLETHDYEAALMKIGGGDVDPTEGMNVWMSTGQTHLWHLGEKAPATPWEAEIDQLMQKQLTTMDYKRRKKLYDRVQEVEAQQLPLIYLASPHILVGAREGLGNLSPAIMDHYLLWNADEIFWRASAPSNH